MSFQVNYAKHFDEYNSQITFAGYRFSQREFMSMAQDSIQAITAYLSFTVPIDDRRRVG